MNQTLQRSQAAQQSTVDEMTVTLQATGERLSGLETQMGTLAQQICTKTDLSAILAEALQKQSSDFHRMMTKRHSCMRFSMLYVHQGLLQGSRLFKFKLPPTNCGATVQSVRIPNWTCGHAHRRLLITSQATGTYSLVKSQGLSNIAFLEHTNYSSFSSFLSQYVFNLVVLGYKHISDVFALSGMFDWYAGVRVVFGACKSVILSVPMPILMNSSTLLPTAWFGRRLPLQWLHKMPSRSKPPRIVQQ